MRLMSVLGVMLSLDPSVQVIKVEGGGAGRFPVALHRGSAPLRGKVAE